MNVDPADQSLPMARPATLPPPLPPAFDSLQPPVARPLEPSLTIEDDPVALSALTRRDALLDFGLVLFVAVVMQFAPNLLLLMLGDVEPPDLSDMLLVNVEKWSGAAMALGLASYLILRHRVAPAAFGLRADGLMKQIAWGVVGYIGVMIVHVSVSVAIGMAMSLTPGAEHELDRRIKFMGSLQPQGTLEISILLIAVVLHEELLFRGMLLSLLRRGLSSSVWALLITSVVFGSLHFPQGWLAMGQITLVSILLGILFLMSRSLIAVMLAHFLFNFGAFQMQRLMPGLKDLVDASNQAG